MNRFSKIAVSLSALLAFTALCRTNSAAVSVSPAMRETIPIERTLPPKISDKRHEVIRNKLRGNPSMWPSWTYQDGSVDVEFRPAGGANWFEHRNGRRVSTTFRVTDRTSTSLTLYEEASNTRVKLYRTKIERYLGTKLDSTFTGGWKYKEWKSTKGQIRFAETTGGNWGEYRDGRAVSTYVVKERNYVDDWVRLFSNDRGVWVMLHGPNHPNQPDRALMDVGDGISIIGIGTFTK